MELATERLGERHGPALPDPGQRRRVRDRRDPQQRRLRAAQRRRPRARHARTACSCSPADGRTRRRGARPARRPRSELFARIDALASQIRDPRRAVFMIHVPPYDSGLDTAPLLDENLRPTISAGDVLRGPVGSKAVRAIIEKYQPVLSVHGHIHEAGGERGSARRSLSTPAARRTTGSCAATSSTSARRASSSSSASRARSPPARRLTARRAGPGAAAAAPARRAPALGALAQASPQNRIAATASACAQATSPSTGTYSSIVWAMLSPVGIEPLGAEADRRDSGRVGSASPRHTRSQGRSSSPGRPMSALACDIAATIGSPGRSPAASRRWTTTRSQAGARRASRRRRTPARSTPRPRAAPPSPSRPASAMPGR